MEDVILKVSGLKKYFPIKSGPILKEKKKVHAVDGVSFSIKRGETLGLVGESGCGKTTVGRLILKLIKADAGRIIFDNKDILSMKESQFRKIRRNMQIIFQDPQSSLNPRMSIKSIIKEPFVINKLNKKVDIDEKIMKLIEMVGLSSEHLNRYPRDLSGGQQQRVGICRAIALNPKFLVLDEPTSALDVCVQAQILNTLKDLQKKLKLTYLFISHDIGVVRHMSNKIAVMYLGKLVETSLTYDLFKNMMHPYTQALFSSIQTFKGELKKKDIIIRGDVPSAINPPSGCRFHPRCPYVMDICKKEEPQLKQVDKDHYVACHIYNDEKSNSLL